MMLLQRYACFLIDFQNPNSLITSFPNDPPPPPSCPPSNFPTQESFRLLLQDPLIQTTPNEQLFRLRYLILKNLASLLARNTSKHHDAVQFYCLATEVDDTDVSVWNRLGTLAAKIQQWSLARRAFERGLALDYTHPTLQAKLFQLLVHIGDRPGTEQLAAALLQAQPDNALAREMSRFSSSSVLDTVQTQPIPITCQLMKLPPVRETDLGQQDDDGREAAAAVVITEEYTLEERSLECLVKFIADKIKSNSGLMMLKLPPKPIEIAQPEGDGQPEEQQQQQQPTDDDATAINFDTKDGDHQSTTIAAALNQDDDPMTEVERNNNDETSAPADNQRPPLPSPVIVTRESKRQKIKYLPGTATNAATGTTILGAGPSGTTTTTTETAAAAADISTEEIWLDYSQDFRDDILPLFQPPDCTGQSKHFPAESQGRENGDGVSPVKKKGAVPVTAAASSSVPTSEELQAQLDDALEEFIATLSSLHQQGSSSGSISVTPTQLGVYLLYALGKFSVPLPCSTWRDVVYIMRKVHPLVDTEGNRQMCLALGAICADVAFMVASDVQQSVAAGPTSPMMTIRGKENANNGGKKRQKLNAPTKADDQPTTTTADTDTDTADTMTDSELLDHARTLCLLWLGRYQCQSYNEHDAVHGQEAVHWWIQGRLHQATNISSTCSNNNGDNDNDINNATSSNVEAQMCYMACRYALLLHTQEYMQEQDDDGDIGEEGAEINVGCCHMDNEISLASIRGKLEILQLEDVALQAALAMKETEKKEEGEGGKGGEAALVSPHGAQPCCTSHAAAEEEEEEKEKQRKGYDKVVDLLTNVLLSCDDREDVMRKTNRVKWQEALETLLKAAIGTANWKLALQCHLRLLDAMLPAVPQEILSLALGEGGTHTFTKNNNNSMLLGVIASYIQALKNASQSTISGACIQQAAAFLSDKCDHLVTRVYDTSWGEGAFSNMELQIMRSTAQKALFAINIMGYAIQNIKVFDTLERLRQMRDGVDATYPIMVDLAVITFHLRQLDFGAMQNANNTYDVLDYLAVTLGESGEVPLAPTGGGGGGGGGSTKKQRSSSVLKRNGIFVKSAMRAAKYEIERMKDVAAAAPLRATRTASVRQRNQQHPSKTAADKDDDDDVTVEDLEGVLFKCVYWLYGIRVQHIKLECIIWGGDTPLEACTAQERSARLHSKQVCLELWPLLKASIVEADDAEEPLSGYDPFFIALIDVVCQPPREEARLLFEQGWKQLQTEEPPTFEDIISSGDGGDGSVGAKTKAKVKIPASITQASKAARDTHVNDPLMLEIHTHVYYWRTLMQDPVNEWVVKAGMKREFLLEPEFESNFEQMLMYNKLDLLYNPERQDSWKMLYDAYLTLADVVLDIAAELVSSRVWQHQTSLQERIANWRKVETWCAAYAYLYAPSDEYKRYVLFFLAVRMARQLDELPPMYNQFTIVRGSSEEEQNKLIEDAKTALSFLEGAVQLAEDSDAFMLHILIGKTLKKMGRPADEYLAHLALACHVATKAFEGGGPTDVFFELHAARLRALMKIGIPATSICNDGRPSSENKLSKENKAALLAVGKYCFLTETVEKIAAAGKIHDSKMHAVLIGDCIAAMKWCLEKNKYFYKASWMLVKLAMLRRDKEAALAELAPFFSSPKARHHVFMVNIFIVSRDEQLDKTLHATSTGRSTNRKRRGRGGGAAGGGGGSGGDQLGGGWEPAETEYGRCPVKQLGVFAAQTDAQHVKNLRKFLVTYIRLCAELGDLKRLQAADEALETSNNSNNSQAGVDGSGQGPGQGIVQAVTKKTLVFNCLDDLAQFIRGQYIVVLLKKLLTVCPADKLLNKMVNRSSDNDNGGFSSVEKRTGTLPLFSATTPASTVRQQQKMQLAQDIAATITDENADADNNDGNADEEGDGTTAATTTSNIVTPTSSEEVLHMAYKVALEHSVLQGEGTVWNSQILAPAALALSDESQNGVEEGEGEEEEGSAVAPASKQLIQTVLPHSRKLFLKYAELYCRVLACQTSLSSIQKLKALLTAFQSYFRREKITPKQASPAVRQTIKLLTAMFIERLERERVAVTKTAEETVPDLEDRLNAPPPSPGKQSLDTIVRNVKSNLPRVPENATEQKSEDKKARVEYLKSVFSLIADDDRIRLVKRLDRELEADQVEVLSEVCTEIGQEYPQHVGEGNTDGEGGRNGDNNNADDDETMLGIKEIQLQDRIRRLLKIMVEFKFLKVIGAWMNQEQQQKKRKKEARSVVESDDASGGAAAAPGVSPLPAAITTTNDAAMTPAMPLITPAPPPVVVVPPPPTTLTRSIVMTDPITSSMSSSLAETNKQVETCIVELYKLYAAIGLTPCPSSHSEVVKAAEELVKVLNKQSEARKEEEKKKRAAERAAVKRAREEAAAAVGEADGGVGAAVPRSERKRAKLGLDGGAEQEEQEGGEQGEGNVLKMEGEEA
jgi:hypothetical protein